MGIIRREENDIKDVFNRLIHRNFRGNIGQAIKNSSYFFSSTLVAKIGSFIFTVILARLLMPELFGLYGLALSTILIFMSFSSSGIGGTLVKFVSKELYINKKKKAKAYAVYIGKIKLALILITSGALLLLSKFAADSYFQKPIFLALVAGAFYIFFGEVSNFLTSLIKSCNYFNGVLYREIFFQSFRIILVLGSVYLALKSGLNDEITLFLLILALSLSYIISSFLTYLVVRKKINFIQESHKELNVKDKKRVRVFIYAMVASALSGAFFSHVDVIMLGHFVVSEFIGYYNAAMSLVVAIIPMISFSSALLPVFSRIKGKELEKGFTKSVGIIFLLSIIIALVVLIFAPIFVNLIFGEAYSDAISVLRVLSSLIVLVPVLTIYEAYFVSIEKPQIVATFLIISTILNIILNYLLISYLLQFGQLQAIIGAAFATVASKAFILTIFIKLKKTTSK